MDAVTRAAELDGLIRRVIMPYSIVGVVLAGLGCLVRFSGLPEIGAEEEGQVEAVHSDKTSIFQFPHLVLGALAIFLHVGTQVLAVDTIIGYAGSMNILLPAAKIFPSYVLMATIAGYLIGIFLIPKYLSQAKALLVCTILGMVFSLLVVFNEGRVSLGWLISLGFANSMIWAGIWPLALEGLGRFTKLGASLLVMGLCGNAILPLVYGALADRWNVRDAYWVLVPCYGYLFFYAAYGHRIRNWFKIKSGVIA
jgi:fucose permease